MDMVRVIQKKNTENFMSEIKDFSNIIFEYFINVF